MVTLPAPFTATKYPGYFWHTEDKKLYSIKMAGELRELKIKHPNYFNKLHEDAYQISHKGIKHYLFLRILEKLTIKDSEISMAK